MITKRKIFKTENRAMKFSDKLKKAGQLDVQIWELPGNSSKNIYAVIWTEAKINPSYYQT